MTSTPGLGWKELLRIAQAGDLMETTDSSSDADRSKPDPDIVKAALFQLGLSGSEAIMVGDTPYDIEAAIRAGMLAIAVRCGGWRDPDLKGAIAIYDGPRDLLAHLAESPLAVAPS